MSISGSSGPAHPDVVRFHHETGDFWPDVWSEDEYRMFTAEDMRRDLLGLCMRQDLDTSGHESASVCMPDSFPPASDDDLDNFVRAYEHAFPRE